jgi:hypothetical protein
MWTADHWRDIVSRATPMFDRLSPTWQTQPLSGDELNGRKAAWQKTAAAGDAALFARRLAWDGLDDALVARLLSPGVTTAALPPWIDALEGVLADVTPAPAGDDPWPFEEIVGALTRAARRRVIARLPGPVLDGFERALFRRLHWFCLRTFELEFDILRSRTGLAGLLESAGRQQYDAFIEGVFADRFQTLFTRYPVLARLVGTTLAHWAAWVEEFAERLAAEGLPPAAGVEAAISDRHDGGRATVIVRFADASVRVYKPRDPSIDVAWARIVEWFNACGPTLPLRCPRVLNRGDYAWVEWIPHHECASRDELARFYRRAGSLMCLFFLLGGNDAHLENLVASGEHPVLVDVETLLHPLLVSGVRPLAVRQAMSDSVMRTGLVGAQVRGAAGRAADFSGLVAGADQLGIVRRPHWRGVGTDAMEIYLDLGLQHGRAHLQGPACARANSSTNWKPASWTRGASSPPIATRCQLTSWWRRPFASCCATRWSTSSRCAKRRIPTRCRTASSTPSAWSGWRASSCERMPVRRTGRSSMPRSRRCRGSISLGSPRRHPAPMCPGALWWRATA